MRNVQGMLFLFKGINTDGTAKPVLILELLALGTVYLCTAFIAQETCRACKPHGYRAYRETPTLPLRLSSTEGRSSATTCYVSTPSNRLHQAIHSCCLTHLSRNSRPEFHSKHCKVTCSKCYLELFTATHSRMSAPTHPFVQIVKGRLLGRLSICNRTACALRPRTVFHWLPTSTMGSG